MLSFDADDPEFRRNAVSFVGSLVLLFLLIIRPQEIWQSLEALHLLDGFTGLALLGVFVELGTGQQKRPFWTPQFPFLIAFLVLCYVTTAINIGTEAFGLVTARAVVASIFMVIVMFGFGTYERFMTALAALVVMAVFVTGVAIHQGMQEPQCIELPKWDLGASEEGEPDGRPCETATGCSRQEGAKEDADYACERVGLFRTVSVVRRVRWRGELNDPNELSVFVGAIIPLLLAVSGYLKKKWFSSLSIAIIGAILYCVILTQSRGGQLVIGTVMGIYFVLRFGMKGILGGLLMALPVVLFGGREDAGAEASSEERIGLLYEGIGVFFQHPILGVGVNQFKEHMPIVQTAHNAYLLAGTEVGLPGFVCWSGILWASLKIPFATIWRKETPEHLKSLATGLIVSFIGMEVGIFFLSFTYKQLLFLWFGLAGALYRIVKDADPGYEVKMSWKDIAGLAVVDMALMVAIFVYTRVRGVS